jgi:hypothetical protein
MDVMCVPEMAFLEEYIKNSEFTKSFDQASAGIADVRNSWEAILGSVFMALFIA